MHTTKINKWGNSMGVRIPKEIIEQLDLSQDHAFLVTNKNGKIILEPIYSEPSLDDLLDKVTTNNRPDSIVLDKPMGREVW